MKFRISDGADVSVDTVVCLDMCPATGLTPGDPFQVKDFLSYLRPAQVFANVVPTGRTLAEVTRM